MIFAGATLATILYLLFCRTPEAYMDIDHEPQRLPAIEARWTFPLEEVMS